MKIRIFMIGILFLVGIQAVQAQAVSSFFRLPLSSYPGISGWYDHYSGSAQLRYDGATSFPYDDHHGTDFPTYRGRDIIAGASGTNYPSNGLYYRENSCYELGDPQYDANCGGGFGNHVRIEHSADGVTIYAHMKRGTARYEGDVGCGDVIGEVGESGVTTGAHIHYELWEKRSIGQRLDFFGGQPSGNNNYWLTNNDPADSDYCSFW